MFRKAWLMLTPAQRRSAAGLLVLLLVGTLLEMTTLGLVVPALALMATDDPAAASPGIAALLSRLGNPSREKLVVGGMSALLAMTVVKSAFLACAAWWQSVLATSIHANIGQSLFRGYLAQPWTFHLQRNSAQLIRNAGYESGYFTGVVSAFLMISADVLVMAGIAVLLLVIQPVGAVISAAMLVVATMLFQRATQPSLARWGRARQHHEGKKLQHLQQGLGGAKDVKVLGREPGLVAAFQRHNASYAAVLQRQVFVGQLPRLWYEMVAVAGLCVLSLTMVLLGTAPARFVPTLGLFAACAFKLLPSINRVMVKLQAVRSAAPAIDTLFAELQLPVPAVDGGASTPIDFKTAVELRDVSFRYPDAASESIRGLSLRIPKGSAVGIIGESGAGKSTIVDILLGLLPPSSGRVTVDGLDIAGNVRGWQRLIGYVPQSIYLSDDTLRRNVAFGVPDEEIDERAVARSLRAAALDEFVAGLPDGVETFVGERGIRLSGGQRQRIGIARAVYHDPEVLVLDEATSALDVETERAVMDAVHSLHGAKTLVVVAHRPTTVAACGVVHRLSRGRLLDPAGAEPI